jgi:MFS family permease
MTNTLRLPRPGLILAGAAVMMSIGMGMRQSLGLFLPPVTHDLALKAADFTFAVAVQNIAWGLSQAPVGVIADKWGLRPAMLAGGVLYIIGMLVMMMAGGAATLAVSGGLVGVALSCTASSLAMTATARAVSPERRSQVLGLVGACSSVGTLLIAPSLQFLLARWDWRIGVVFFILLAVAMLPASYLAGAVDRIPSPDQARASMREVLGTALRNRRYLVMTCAYFVCGLQLIVLTTHLPNYLAICGQDPMLSATALATIGGINIFGSWFAGWLGAISEIPPAGIAVLVAIAGALALLHAASDPHQHDRLRRRNGHAVARRDPAGFGLRGGAVRYPLHGHHPGHFVRRPPDGIGHRRLGWRDDLRPVRVL